MTKAMKKETYVPMAIRKERATIKRRIESIERSRKEIWRRFKTSVMGEAEGSPFYVAQYGNARLRDSDLRGEIEQLKRRLPPFQVWNAKLGCLEIKQVSR
jgi:hypothetical protein